MLDIDIQRTQCNNDDPETNPVVFVRLARNSPQLFAALRLHFPACKERTRLAHSGSAIDTNKILLMP